MMPPGALLRLGTRNLMVHKLRSTLSILGVVFGVAAVVAMSSVGEGARREALAQVSALGIDSITIKNRPAPDASPRPGLRLSDVASLRAVVPHVVAAAAVREAPLQAEVTGRHTQVTAVGTTPDYALAARLRLSRGRFLSDLDVTEAKRVAVLGASAARELFPLQDPRGERFLMGGDFFQVVGVLEGRSAPRGRTGPIRTRDVNRAVFVPLPSMDRGGDGRPDGIDEAVLRVDDGDHVASSAEVVKVALRRTAADANLEIVVPREILRQREATQRIFNVVTGAIAAISLLVGGIGIMNIMLASVAERTREVGVRRALGATRRDVASQFLVEASLLTTAGGFIGAVLGTLGAVLIQVFAAWPTALSPLLLLLALVVALGVGVGFGFYPAWAAANLSPMEALRRE